MSTPYDGGNQRDEGRGKTRGFQSQRCRRALLRMDKCPKLKAPKFVQDKRIRPPRLQQGFRVRIDYRQIARLEAKCGFPDSPEREILHCVLEACSTSSD